MEPANREALAAITGVALVPVLSLVLDLPFHFSLTRRYLESPFAQGEGAGAAAINLAFFLAMVLAGTALMILLVKLGKVKLLPLLFSLSIFFSFFAIADIFFSAYCEKSMLFCGAQSDILSIALAVVTAYLVVKPSYPKLLSALLMLYGAMAGSLFYELLPAWSLVVIAAGMAAYDIYAVFHGPLKYILENVLEPSDGKPGHVSHNPLRGASVQLGAVTLGMGDVLVYSMLSPLYYFYPSPSPARWIFSITALVAGFYMTLSMLKKRRFMPALPLPVFLSLGVYLVLVQLGV